MGADAPPRHAARSRELSLLLVGAAPRPLDGPQRARRSRAAVRAERHDRNGDIRIMSTSANTSAGAAFRAAVAAEKPLQVVGAINANHALLAQRQGFKAIYVSGG